MANPEAAAVPAIPTKCPLPMLLAKSDAPICGGQGYICKNVIHNTILMSSDEYSDWLYFYCMSFNEYIRYAYHYLHTSLL